MTISHGTSGGTHTLRELESLTLDYINYRSIAIGLPKLNVAFDQFQRAQKKIFAACASIVEFSQQTNDGDNSALVLNDIVAALNREVKAILSLEIDPIVWKINGIILLNSHEAKQRWLRGDFAASRYILSQLGKKFPGLLSAPQYLLPAGGMSIESNDIRSMETCLSAVQELIAGKKEVSELLQLLKICLVLALSKHNAHDFEYRFRELKAKLEHACLLDPLTPSTLLPEVGISLASLRTVQAKRLNAAGICKRFLMLVGRLLKRCFNLIKS